MAYGDFKHLPWRTSDKVLCDEVWNIAKNLKYGYQHGLAPMFNKLFDEMPSGNGFKSEIMLKTTVSKRITQTSY